MSDVNQPEIDPERLAALRDGKLSRRERDELVARLAASEGALEAYADAAAAIAEARPASDSDSSRVAPTAALRRVKLWQWVAVAAALAGVTVGWFVRTRTQAAQPQDPARFVAMLPGQEAGARWPGADWGSTRGTAETQSPESRAVRLGALLVDLELARRAGDPAEARLTDQIVELLRAVPGGAATAKLFENVPRAGGPKAEALVVKARLRAARLTGAELVEMGAWLEAGRAAAARGDESFFRRPDAHAVVERLATSRTLPPEANDAVQRLHSEITTGDLPPWNELESSLTELLRLLGR